ncbi:MAG: GIY-YIG nuclease family protein, partial [Nanoarchaeota archaeon]
MIENSKKYGIIYLLFNKINEKPYVGQTIQNFKDRLGGHLYGGERMVIQKAIKKYGIENFEKLEIDEAENQEELDYLEEMYAVLFNSYAPNGYNIQKCGRKNRESIVGEGGSKNYKFLLTKTNEIIEIFNLKKFSVENNLDYRHLYQVANGKRYSHKGYIKY